MTLRCAIYTRKSTEEGLEQEFNSLDAQREACAAYILSQRHEGWRESKTRYDDGGFSGGSMDRPGLQALLDDVTAGRIDVVVVYKVDRLTRALTDFARMVEIFEKAGVSFVSVTQQFNTTTSMGRLTLNVLLSFAQFERDVAAERIRDKIAASKRKGMWMGGVPPLGYDVRDKALHVNDAEAETIQTIFRRYIKLGSVRALKDELDRSGMVGKRRISRKGRVSGGARFTRGALYALLRNPIYVGEVSHKGERHKGRHAAIINRELWDATQARLAQHGGGARAGRRRATVRPLDGVLFDRHGRPMRPTSAIRHVASGGARATRRYDYYATRPVGADDDRQVMRLPAVELESAVRSALALRLGDPNWTGEALREAGVAPARVGDAIRKARSMAEAFSNADDLASQGEMLRSLAERIDMRDARLSILIRPDALCESNCELRNSVHPICINARLDISQAGNARPIVIRGAANEPRRDPDLIALVADARRWMNELVSGEIASVAEITERERKGKGAVSRILPLAYLAPDIAEAILAGRQPADLTATRLRSLKELPADWSDQRAILGFTG